MLAPITTPYTHTSQNKQASVTFTLHLSFLPPSKLAEFQSSIYIYSIYTWRDSLKEGIHHTIKLIKILQAIECTFGNCQVILWRHLYFLFRNQTSITNKKITKIAVGYLQRAYNAKEQTGTQIIKCRTDWEILPEKWGSESGGAGRQWWAPPAKPPSWGKVRPVIYLWPWWCVYPVTSLWGLIPQTTRWRRKNKVRKLPSGEKS